MDLKNSMSPIVVAKGCFPDIAVDDTGDVHIVYGREDCLYYRRYDRKSNHLQEEQFTSVIIHSTDGFGIERSEPNIVIDSKNMPHVFAGSEYACIKGVGWEKNTPKLGELLRDTSLCIDKKDNLYLTHRGGNNGGFIGALKLSFGNDQWEALTDPDKPYIGKNDHVYGEIAVSPYDNSLHVIYRHGQPKKTAYRLSNDDGTSWVAEGITDNEPESPHIIVDSKNNVYATDGGGNFFKRTEKGWLNEVQAVPSKNRMQPELAVDSAGNIYCGMWGGCYNIRFDGNWIGQMNISSVTGKPIGFVKMIGAKNFAYAVWEEGNTVNADKGSSTVDIVVGRINCDGRIEGLK